MSKYPEDEIFFKTYAKKEKKKKMLQDAQNYVICPICCKKFEKITLTHIETHNLSLSAFKNRYPNIKMSSEKVLKENKFFFQKGNLVVSKNRFISKTGKRNM